MTEKYKIRPVCYSDIKQIYEIEKLSFAYSYPYSLLDSLRSAAPDTYLVYEEDGKILGYVVAVILDNSAAHIVSIAVHPNYRRRGIATLLMNELLKILEMKKIDLIFLEVRVNNDAALHLYTKFGFKITKILKNYYEDKCDAFVMTRHLKKSVFQRKN